MFFDKDGNNTVLEFGSKPTYAGRAHRFVLTKGGTLYKIYYGDVLGHLFPSGNIDELAQDDDSVKVLEEGINTDIIIDYVNEALHFGKSGCDGYITIPQSFSMNNGCDGSWDSIEILDQFRTKGHLLFAFLLGQVPTTVINRPDVETAWNNLHGEENDYKLKGLLECSCLFINVLKLLYNECKHEETKKSILVRFPRSHNNINFDVEGFFNDGNTLLETAYDMRKYVVDNRNKEITNE